MLHAASHGLFSFDDRVGDHWPAFKARGKADITIRQRLAANGHGTARAVAVAYGEIAAGGERLGITPEVLADVSSAADDPTQGLRDVVLHTDSRFSLGYCKPWQGFDFGTPSAFGTPGAGGSLGFGDPERKLGFAYVMNGMDYYIFDDPRKHALREAVIDCLAASS